jgi:predicted site-specific integrase-resolvase
MKNEKEENFVSIGKASILTGLSKQTLRKMADDKTISSYLTPTNQRRINTKSIQKMCYSIDDDEKVNSCTRKNFLYTRVSTKKQMDDLTRQVQYVKRPEYDSYILIQDIGSGINFKRKGLQTILECCIQRTIGEVIIAHRDRLCRFAFELIESIINKAGGTIKVLDNELNKSSENELAEDLLSIIHIFNCRQMGKRSYKKRPEQIQNNQNKDLSNKITNN